MYKLKPDGYILNTQTGAYFDDNSYLWDEYQEWIGQGNIPEPIYTVEELKSIIVSGIKSERNKRIDLVTGDDRQKRLSMIAAIKINRKRSKGDLLTPEDESKDLFLNKLSDHIELLSEKAKNEIDWILAERTAAELESYDINLIEWPVYVE